MAKKKENSEEVPLDGEVLASDDNTASSDSVQATESVEAKVSAPSRLSIQTQEEALAYVNENYQVPAGCKLVLVTEDVNVFWEDNVGAAHNHAERHNLKLFRLVWQG